MELARILLKYGADANELHGLSEVPALHIAIVYGHIDLARLLLRYNADPDSKNGDGQTAFDVSTNLLV